MKLNLFESFEPEEPIIVLGERYSLVKRLSTNGLAQTYLAKDLHAPGHPDCVVSQFRTPEDHPSDPPIIRTLFQAEANAFSRLEAYDCVPELLAHFEVEGDFYFVWENVEGHSLAEELASPVPWSDRRVVSLLNDLLSTLEVIHQSRIVHLNLQPANLIRRHKDSRLALVGFGSFQQASALVISPTPTTSTPPLFNTSPYMPDEQVAGHPHPSSDVYAVGLIAVQALTGRRPETIPTDPRTREFYWQSMASLSHPALLSLLDHMIRSNFRTRCQTASEALEALSALPPEITWFVPADEDTEIQSVDRALAAPTMVSAGAAESTEALISQPAVVTEQASEAIYQTSHSVQNTVESRQDPPRYRSRRILLPIVSAVLALLGTGALLVWRFPDNSLVAERDSPGERRRQRSVSQENSLSNGDSVDVGSPEAVDSSAESDLSVTADSSAVTTEESVPERGESANAMEGNTSRQAFDDTTASEGAVSSAEISSEDESLAEVEVAVGGGQGISSEESSARLLAPEAAKTTVIQFYNSVANRSWDSARALLSENMAERLEPDFFYQFQDVSVENMRVVNQTPDLADLVVQNTYVYLDGSYQQEERNYTVQMVDNQPTIVDTAFVEVIRDRNY